MKWILFIPQIRKIEAERTLFISQIRKIEAERTWLFPEIGKIEAKKTDWIEVNEQRRYFYNFYGAQESIPKNWFR